MGEGFHKEVSDNAKGQDGTKDDAEGKGVGFRGVHPSRRIARDKREVSGGVGDTPAGGARGYRSGVSGSVMRRREAVALVTPLVWLPIHVPGGGFTRSGLRVLPLVGTGTGAVVGAGAVVGTTARRTRAIRAPVAGTGINSTRTGISALGSTALFGPMTWFATVVAIAGLGARPILSLSWS